MPGGQVGQPLKKWTAESAALIGGIDACFATAGAAGIGCYAYTFTRVPWPSESPAEFPRDDCCLLCSWPELFSAAPAAGVGAA
jgi:hypothetical protein